MKKLLLPILFSFVLAACAHNPQTPRPNQPYLDAEKTIQSLPQDQFLVLNDGTIYIGEIQNNNANGFGKLISKDGSVYQGEVKNGQANGFGKSEMSTGESYEGEHQQGNFEGRGRLILSNGSAFIGTFKNNKAHRGQMFYTDGSTATN